MPFVAMVVYNPPAHEGRRRLRRRRRLDAAGRSAKDKAASRMQEGVGSAGLYTLPPLGRCAAPAGASGGHGGGGPVGRLSDAPAPGWKTSVRKNFNRPDLVIILDFTTRPGGWRSWLAVGTKGTRPRPRSGRGQWCALLKRHAAKLLNTQALPPPGRKAAQAKYQETLGYLGNHKHRMDYPEYQRQGWYIGSGPGGRTACGDGRGAAAEAGGRARGGGRHGPRSLSPAGPVQEPQGPWKPSEVPDEQRFNFLPTKLTLTRRGRWKGAGCKGLPVFGERGRRRPARQREIAPLLEAAFPKSSEPAGLTGGHRGRQ